MSTGKLRTSVRKAATQRPGGRTSDVTQRVFSATVELLEEGGFSEVTFKRVAEKAGVGRATLYRRWPEPAFLVGDALAATAAEHIRIADTGNLRGDLFEMLVQIGAFIDSPMGRASIVATLTARQHPEFASFAQELWRRRRGDVLPIFERAKQREELSPETDPDTLFSVLAGSLYLRMIVMAAPIDNSWINACLDQVLGPMH